MNILNCYIEFKYRNIYSYVDILVSGIKTDFSRNVVNKLIDTYIKTYYFHHLQTLDEVEEYNIEVIISEFNGKALEIIYELDDSINKEKATNLVNIFKDIVLCAIKIDKIDDSFKREDRINEIKKIIKKYKYNEDLLNDLSKTKLINNNIENKFLKGLIKEDFELKYNLYRNKKNIYYVILNSQINQLKKYYSEKSIKKNLNKEKIAKKKFITTINLLNIDILYKIMNSENIDYYFINIPECLLEDKEEILEILNMIDNEYVREHIVLLIDYNYYLNHKKILNLIDIKYSFAAIVDMSHIRDVEEKIENVEIIKIFDYVVIDKVKSKDYEIVNKYESITGKQIFINELDNEE